MKNHMYFTSLTAGDITDETAKLRDLKYLIREDRELDQKISNDYPLESFGLVAENIRVKGSKSLLEAFYRIDAEKIDLIEKLENIEFMGFTHDDEIVLRFINDDWSASGIYDFTYDFFEELFKMGKYANFCLENDYQDLIRENITELFAKLPDIEKQYRFLMKNDELLLRGFTSARYNDYDNHLALYLSLLALNKFASENDLQFNITRAYLSDSAIKVFFEQENFVRIPGVGDIYFGAVVTNSEIRDSMFTFEMRYRIVDHNNPDISFSAIPELKDSVFKINHTTKVSNLGERLEDMFRLKDLQNLMIKYINELKNMKVISSDALYKLFNLVIYSRYFNAETKSIFKNLYSKELVNNTLTLLEAFNKVNEITTDIDEKTHLERIYHQLITEILKS